MEAKCKSADIELAHTREELIEKELAGHQAAYLLINLRQKMLQVPARLKRRFGDAFSREMMDCAREFVHDALKEASQLPQSVEPGWLERLKEEED
jgi:hypothetical protein